MHPGCCCSAARQKAAWGGHAELCRWLRDECGAIDNVQDDGGNYAADVADMGGHDELARWLRDECSDARARSLGVLGLPADTTDPAVVRAAYLEAARRLHPDRAAAAETPTGGGGTGASSTSAPDFDAACAAYKHLSEEGGRGQQSNPSHSLRRMLRATTATDGAAAECRTSVRAWTTTVR